MINSSDIPPKPRIYLLLFLLILVWGLSWPITKIGLQYMPPLWFSTLRLVIGTLSMFAVVQLLKKHIRPRKEDLKIILVIGLLQVGMFMVLINVGLYYVEAGRAAILVYTTPIWVVPISIFFFKEQATLMKWAGFIFGIIGILILFNPFEVNWGDHDVLFGNGALLLAALCWAISILCARHMYWPHTPLELISWQLLVGTVPVLLFTVIKQPHPHIMWNHALLFSLLYSGILATAFAYWGTVEVSKELSPVTTSLSLLAVPVCGLIFSAIILHEIITPSIVIAMFFILAGLLCVVVKRKDQSAI